MTKFYENNNNNIEEEIDNNSLVSTNQNTYPTWTKAFIKMNGSKVKIKNMKNNQIIGKIVSEDGITGDFKVKDISIYSDITSFKSQLDLGGLEQLELLKRPLRSINNDMYQATTGKVFGPMLTSGSYQDRIKNAQHFLRTKKIDNLYLVALDPESESKLTLNSLGDLARNKCLLIGGSSEIHVGTSQYIKPESKGFKILGKKPMEEVYRQLDETLKNNIDPNVSEGWIGGSWAYLFRVPKNRVKDADEEKELADKSDKELTDILKLYQGFGEKILENSYYRFSKDITIAILKSILNQKTFCELKCNKLTVFNAQCVLYILEKIDKINYIYIGWDGKTV